MYICGAPIYMYDTYICGATLNVLHSLSQIKIFKSNLISVEYFCATRGFSCISFKDMCMASSMLTE